VKWNPDLIWLFLIVIRDILDYLDKRRRPPRQWRPQLPPRWWFWPQARDPQ